MTIFRYLKTHHILLLFFVWAAGCVDAQAQPNGAWVMGKGLGLDFSTGFPLSFESKLSPNSTGSNYFYSSGTIYLDTNGNKILSFDSTRIYDYINDTLYYGIDSIFVINYPTGGSQSFLVPSKNSNNCYFIFYFERNLSTQWSGDLKCVKVCYNEDFSKLNIVKGNILIQKSNSWLINYYVQIVEDTIRITMQTNLNYINYPRIDSFAVISLLEDDSSNLIIQSKKTLVWNNIIAVQQTNGGGNIIFEPSVSSKGLSSDFALLALPSLTSGLQKVFYLVLRSNSDTLNHTVILDTLEYDKDNFNPNGGSEPGYYPTALEFSPNGRYVYVLVKKIDSLGSNSTQSKMQMRQYDLVEHNWELVWECGREMRVGCDIMNTMDLMRISPDGRILFGDSRNFRRDGQTTSGIIPYAIGAIHNPNKKGKECKVEFPYMILAEQAIGEQRVFYGFPKYLGNYQFPAFSLAQNCIDTAVFINESGTGFTAFMWVVDDIDTIYRYDYEPLRYKFNKSGKHVVRLRARDVKGYKHTFADSINILHKPKAFYTSDSEKGCQWVAFSFKNQSQYDTIQTQIKWHWQSGDGFDTTMLGGQGNFSHIYRKDGLYPSRIIMDNGFCTDTFALPTLVEILPAPQPGFSFSPQSGCQPLEIHFTDKHADVVDSVRFQFGDGQQKTRTSHFINEPHTFVNPGNYTVKQLLYGPTGCVTQSQQNLKVLKGFDNTVSLHLHYATLNEAENTHQIFWQNLADAKRYVLNQQSGSTWQKIYEGKDTLYEHIPAQAIGVYRYQISAYDTCGKSLASNTGTTLLLQGKTQENEYAILHWNDYDYWPMGISAYSLEKQNPQNQEWELLLSTADTAATDLNFFDVQFDEACYRVKARANQNSNYQSTSNSICLPYSPLFWIPDAFTPNGDGRNDAFKPMSSGILNEGYELLIYNRWGALVFATQNRNTAWDGSYEGKPVPEGLYVYQIKFSYTDQKGITRKKNHKGQVSLIR